MTRPEKAVELFGSGFNCAQAMLMAFAAESDLDPRTAAKLASGFGGGMGCMAGTCGAVSTPCVDTNPAEHCNKTQYRGVAVWHKSGIKRLQSTFGNDSPLDIY